MTINAPALQIEAERLGVPERRLMFIPNGVAIPEIAAPNVSKDPPTAVVVANYRWYKGHDVLMHALSVTDRTVRVRLLGEGDELRRRTLALAAELGVAERVDFVSYPPNVPHELHEAQFAIHPSRTEGLSNAILEETRGWATCSRRPMSAATKILIDDGVEGFLVPPGDAAALAVAIEKLALDPALRARMSIAARAKAMSFSWDRCIDSYERLLFEEDAMAGVGRTKALQS